MKRFNTRVFQYAFPIAVGLALTIALAVVVDVRTASGIGISDSVILAILSSVVFAGLVASYYFPIRACVWAYRTVMRSLAKKAIRSSLSHAMTQIRCLGILNRDGTVALRIETEKTHEIGIGVRLNVYDSANGQLWGKVEVVEMDDTTYLCELIERINPVFWEHLEDRMLYDTSPPDVYLVSEVPIELMNEMERILLAN